MNEKLAKNKAKRLRSVLAEKRVEITHQQSLQALARIEGHRSWEEWKASASAPETTPTIPEGEWRCFVIASNSEGDTDFCLIRILASSDARDEGLVQAAAKAYAEEHGYESPLVVDQLDALFLCLRLPSWCPSWDKVGVIDLQAESGDENAPLSAEEIQNHPQARSISDDDLCSGCKFLQYAPGNLSLCRKRSHEWPATFNSDGYAEACPHFSEAACWSNVVVAEGDRLEWRIVMSSDLFGEEHFNYDSRSKAMEGYARLLQGCSKGECSKQAREFQLDVVLFPNPDQDSSEGPEAQVLHTEELKSFNPS